MSCPIDVLTKGNFRDKLKSRSTSVCLLAYRQELSCIGNKACIEKVAGMWRIRLRLVSEIS